MVSQQPYKEQIETGKKIITKVLEKLATDLDQPQINDFAFKETSQDFDHNLVP